MLISIFLQGTIIMHKNAKNKTRQQIINQIKNKDPSVHDSSTYIPIGHAHDKIKKWKNQGARIVYISSLTRKKYVREDEKVKDYKAEKQILKKYGFPNGRVIHRQKNEQYADIIEKLKPDILIEDDCQSIGGIKQTCFYGLNSQEKNRIKHVVVKEFSGIDKIKL